MMGNCNYIWLCWLLVLHFSQYLPDSRPVQTHLCRDLAIAPAECAEFQNYTFLFGFVGVFLSIWGKHGEIKLMFMPSKRVTAPLPIPVQSPPDKGFFAQIRCLELIFVTRICDQNDFLYTRHQAHRTQGRVGNCDRAEYVSFRRHAPPFRHTPAACGNGTMCGRGG